MAKPTRRMSGIRSMTVLGICSSATALMAIPARAKRRRGGLNSRYRRIRELAHARRTFRMESAGEFAHGKRGEQERRGARQRYSGAVEGHTRNETSIGKQCGRSAVKR